MQLLGGSDARGPRGEEEDLPGAPASRERCGFPAVPSVYECAVEGASPVLRGQERTAASPLSLSSVTPLSSVPLLPCSLLVCPWTSLEASQQTGPSAWGFPRVASASVAVVSLGELGLYLLHSSVGSPSPPAAPSLGVPCSLLPTDLQPSPHRPIGRFFSGLSWTAHSSVLC